MKLRFSAISFIILLSAMINPSPAVAIDSVQRAASVITVYNGITKAIQKYSSKSENLAKAATIRVVECSLLYGVTSRSGLDPTWSEHFGAASEVFWIVAEKLNRDHSLTSKQVDLNQLFEIAKKDLDAIAPGRDRLESEMLLMSCAGLSEETKIDGAVYQIAMESGSSHNEILDQIQ